MLAAMIGLLSASDNGVSTMAQMAAAAREKTMREIRLSPATSTMAGIMAMSLVPK